MSKAEEAFLSDGDSSSSDEEKEEKAPEEGQAGLVKTVYVGNISFKATEDELKKFFADCGKIKKIQYPINQHNKGTAFITFASVDGAEEAVDLTGANMFDRKLNIRFRHKGHIARKPPNCRIVYVGNLNFKANESDLKKHFSSCGEVVGVRIPANSRGFKFGKAYVEFTETKAVDQAVQLNGSEMMGRKLIVNWALPDKVEKLKKELRESHTLFVGGLPFNYGVQHISKWLTKHDVDPTKCRIRLQRRPDGKSSGSCYVDFEDYVDFFKALKQDNTVVGGRRVVVSVKMANKRKRDEPVGPNKRQKKTYVEKLPETKQLRSLLIHGAPRSFTFEDMAQSFSEFNCESFGRDKGTVLATFSSRQMMGRALVGMNSFVEYNSRNLKLTPVIQTHASKPYVVARGFAKDITLANVQKHLETTYGVEVMFCTRKKKKGSKEVIVECVDEKSKQKLLDLRKEKIGDRPLSFTKA